MSIRLTIRLALATVRSDLVFSCGENVPQQLSLIHWRLAHPGMWEKCNVSHISTSRHFHHPKSMLSILYGNSQYCELSSFKKCLISIDRLRHDSQFSIPLPTMTYQRVINLYDLKDSAFDCRHIIAYIQSLGHVPIIDPNPRNGETRELDPAEKIRYRERTTVERVNARLKDEFGSRMVRVQGAVKVMAHLMFGILAVTVDQIIRMAR